MLKERINFVLSRAVFSEKGTCELDFDVRVGVSLG